MWDIHYLMVGTYPTIQNSPHLEIPAAWLKLLYILTSYVSITYHILSMLLAKLSK